MHNKKSLRDFLYLNVDWLNSLSSQVFEGITSQIIETVTDEKKAINTTPNRGASTEQQVVEAALRTENKILYDHLYTLLENRIANALNDLSVRAE